MGDLNIWIAMMSPKFSNNSFFIGYNIDSSRLSGCKYNIVLTTSYYPLIYTLIVTDFKSEPSKILVSWGI